MPVRPISAAACRKCAADTRTPPRYAQPTAPGPDPRGAPPSGVGERTVERCKLTYATRSAMLGEMPARYETHEFDVDTDGLDEKTDEQVIVDKLHHVIDEHTDGAGVLTGAERIPQT